MSGKIILKVVICMVLVVAVSVLFIGAYGGVLQPAHPIEFYTLTVTLVFLLLGPVVLL